MTNLTEEKMDMPATKDSIKDLAERMANFARERDWGVLWYKIDDFEGVNWPDEERPRGHHGHKSQMPDSYDEELNDVCKLWWAIEDKLLKYWHKNPCSTLREILIYARRSY
tara:strand:- start:62 stop:394 length:333 start_codon:yes stop_codon:yes gene_type:complete